MVAYCNGQLSDLVSLVSLAQLPALDLVRLLWRNIILIFIFNRFRYRHGNVVQSLGWWMNAIFTDKSELISLKASWIEKALFDVGVDRRRSHYISDGPTARTVMSWINHGHNTRCTSFYSETRHERRAAITARNLWYSSTSLNIYYQHGALQKL